MIDVKSLPPKTNISDVLTELKLVDLVYQQMDCISSKLHEIALKTVHKAKDGDQ